MVSVLMTLVTVTNIFSHPVLPAWSQPSRVCPAPGPQPGHWATTAQCPPGWSSQCLMLVMDVYASWLVQATYQDIAALALSLVEKSRYSEDKYK